MEAGWSAVSAGHNVARIAENYHKPGRCMKVLP